MAEEIDAISFCPINSCGFDYRLYSGSWGQGKESQSNVLVSMWVCRNKVDWLLDET